MLNLDMKDVLSVLQACKDYLILSQPLSLCWQSLELLCADELSVRFVSCCEPSAGSPCCWQSLS